MRLCIYGKRKVVFTSKTLHQLLDMLSWIQVTVWSCQLHMLEQLQQLNTTEENKRRANIFARLSYDLAHLHLKERTIPDMSTFMILDPNTVVPDNAISVYVCNGTQAKPQDCLVHALDKSANHR
jgi:hypothetical protein